MGAGIEYALWNAWSIAAEYRHSDFGRKSFVLASPDPSGKLGFTPETTTVKLTLDQVTVRANWRFSPR